MSDMTYDPKTHNTEWGRKLRDRIHKRGQRGSNRPMTGFRARNRFKAPAPYQDDKTKRVVQPPPVRVRLIPGAYRSFDGSTVPYCDYVEHFCKRVFRGFICSKKYTEDADGHLESTGDCVCCYERDENSAQDISWRQMSGFLMLWLDWFYLIPATDRDGKNITYQQDSKFHKKGDPVLDRVLAEDAEDEHGIRHIKRQGYEKVFGKLMHWSLGNNHLLTLTAKQEDLSNTCQCGGKIEKPLWECANCENPIIDLTDEDGREKWGKKKLAEATQNPYGCKKCGTVGMLRPILDCVSCGKPEPLRIWDVDLEVCRQGDNTQSQLIISDHHPCDLDEDAAALIPQKDILHRVFAPDDHEYVAKALRVRNVFKDNDTRRNVEDYDEKEKGGDKEDASDEDIPY